MKIGLDVCIFMFLLRCEILATDSAEVEGTRPSIMAHRALS